MESNRRTFLVGLGRFMMGAAAASIVKAPVLYSFPSEIRIASSAEQTWLLQAQTAIKNVRLSSSWEEIENISYAFTFNVKLAK